MRRENLRHDILRPVFQVRGEDAVGSAVLVYHDVDEKGPYYLALSCYHVLRDIVAAEKDKDPHTVEFDNIFDQIGSEPITVQGIMLAEKIDSDLALLRIDTELMVVYHHKVGEVFPPYQSTIRLEQGDGFKLQFEDPEEAAESDKIRRIGLEVAKRGK